MAPRRATPALALGPRRPGEVVLTGQVTPAADGPHDFHGRYRVRFQQVDPSSPGESFTAQTAFVAYAAPQPDQTEGSGARLLIRGAARGGTRTVALDGRLWVNVSFGDFPYALRLTPVR